MDVVLDTYIHFEYVKATIQWIGSDEDLQYDTEGHRHGRVSPPRDALSTSPHQEAVPRHTL